MRYQYQFGQCLGSIGQAIISNSKFLCIYWLIQWESVYDFELHDFHAMISSCSRFRNQVSFVQGRTPMLVVMMAELCVKKFCYYHVVGAGPIGHSWLSPWVWFIRQDVTAPSTPSPLQESIRLICYDKCTCLRFGQCHLYFLHEVPLRILMHHIEMLNTTTIHFH
jgi:hypothetical protein